MTREVRERQPRLVRIEFEDDAADLDEDVAAALKQLPADQRAVVVLRHLLGYTPREIGRMLDLPTGTVNSRMRRGLDTLEGELT